MEEKHSMVSDGKKEMLNSICAYWLHFFFINILLDRHMGILSSLRRRKPLLVEDSNIFHANEGFIAFAESGTNPIGNYALLPASNIPIKWYRQDAQSCCRWILNKLPNVYRIFTKGAQPYGKHLKT